METEIKPLEDHVMTLINDVINKPEWQVGVSKFDIPDRQCARGHLPAKLSLSYFRRSTIIPTPSTAPRIESGTR